MIVEPVKKFIVERETIRIKKERGDPAPWTTDPVLANFRFTNVYREDDKVTRWGAEYVRTAPSPILACTVFRWFNRISTGDAIFEQQSATGETAWEMYLRTGNVFILGEAIRAACGSGPYVTGVYIVKTPQGFTKLDGVLWCIEKVQPYVEAMGKCYTLQDAFETLLCAPYQGSFTAAQVIADIKFLPQFSGAADFDTFVASGPGSRKGLNIVMGCDIKDPWGEKEFRETLLDLRERLKPTFIERGWKTPTAQDVQNVLCEYSKWCRGSSRNVYKPTLR
jgi:hypothetical protein